MSTPGEKDSTPPKSASVASRLLRFGGLQAANAIIPLLVLPTVIAIIGPDGWVGLANGLGIGAAAAVAIGLAWPITGPPRVAGVDDEVARDVFAEALVMRALVFLPVVALMSLVVVGLTPDTADSLLPISMVIATALNGLSSNWYFIGCGRAGDIVIFETLPKVVATALAIPVVMWTQEPTLYPALLAVAAVGGIVTSTGRITRFRGLRAGLEPAMRRLASQIPLGLVGLLGVGSSALAVPVATLSGAPLGHVGAFAAAVRLRSMAQAGIGAGTTALQGWVAEQGTARVWSRFTRAITVNGTLGLLAGLTMLLLAPLVDTLIFGPDVQIDHLTALILGATCLFYSLSASLSHHLLGPLNRTRYIVSATAISSIVAVPAVFFGAREWGAAGSMAGVCLAEGLTVLIQARAALQVRREVRGV